MKPVWIIGNGGHAKVVIDAILMQGIYEIAGLISDDPEADPVLTGVLHLGPVSRQIVSQTGINTAVMAIGSNLARKRIAIILDETVDWVSAVHPSAIVSPSATVGQDIVLCAGSIIQPYVTVGDHVIINTGATVDHDCVVGDFVHIAPGAHLAGSVNVGAGALIGLGASVLPGISIGRNAVIGAGSVVIRDVPEEACVAGVPARPLC